MLLEDRQILEEQKRIEEKSRVRLRQAELIEQNRKRIASLKIKLANGTTRQEQECLLADSTKQRESSSAEYAALEKIPESFENDNGYIVHLTDEGVYAVYGVIRDEEDRIRAIGAPAHRRAYVLGHLKPQTTSRPGGERSYCVMGALNKAFERSFGFTLSGELDVIPDGEEFPSVSTEDTLDFYRGHSLSVASPSQVSDTVKLSPTSNPVKLSKSQKRRVKEKARAEALKAGCALSVVAAPPLSLLPSKTVIRPVLSVYEESTPVSTTSSGLNEMLPLKSFH